MKVNRLVNAESNIPLSRAYLDLSGEIDYSIVDSDFQIGLKSVFVNESKIIMLIPGEIGILCLDGDIELLIDEESVKRVSNYLGQ